MKKIIAYFKDYLKTEFHLGLYLSIALFLAVSIYLNYLVDFEDNVIDSFYGRPIRILWYFLLYAFAYYSTCLLVAIFKKDWSFFKSPTFWIVSILGLGLGALDAGSHYHRLITSEFPVETRYFMNKVLSNMASVITVLLPLYLFYKFKDKKQESFYGLTTKNFDWKPYGILLLLMVPLIVTASFNKGFINYYPTIKPNGFAEYMGISNWQSVLMYEFAYGFDFITVELLFRGFLILGMVSVLGKNAVLPMAVLYAFIHFGKPAGETVSSIFGGYILGVIALYSRSVLGGVYIHMGIAWLMEIVAFGKKNWF